MPHLVWPYSNGGPPNDRRAQAMLHPLRAPTFAPAPRRAAPRSLGSIAQLVQSIPPNRRESRCSGRVLWKCFDIGGIAQLVQSICLTSRGSLVRIRLPPPSTIDPDHMVRVNDLISWDVSSAGSERMLHTHEVTGSNPVRPTSPGHPGLFLSHTARHYDRICAIKARSGHGSTLRECPHPWPEQKR